MYESFFKEIESSLKPALDVAEINRKALEKLATVQSNCLSECIEASVKQFQALTTAADPQAAAELQIKFFQDFETKLVNTAELNVATLTEASEELKAVVEQSFEDLAKASPVKFEELFSSLDLEELSKLNPLAEMFANAAPVAAAKPAAKPAPAKKEAAKPAAKKAPVRRAAAKPAVKAEAKPAAKKEEAKPVAKKAAPAKKPAAKKAAPAKKPAAKKAAPAKKADAPKAAAPKAEAAPQKPVKTKAAPAAAKAAPARAAAPKATKA